jgi:hypoxanthine phosphoribosyltransferase
MQSSSLTSPLEAAQAELIQGIGRVIFSQAEIQSRVGDLAGEISRDYAGLNPLLVGVLKGVVFFASDLLRAITIPVKVDFMAISRYVPHDSSPKGPVKLIKDLDESVEGQHIIFLEDVIDTGLTLSYLLRILKARGPASLEVCALFNKPHHRLATVPIKYKGFDLLDRFVVGYGLDYREAYRHLPFVGELRAEILNLE